MLQTRINEFHKVFGLPTPDVPQAPTIERLTRFRQILLDEFSESEDILTELSKNYPTENPKVLLADWLGDMIIYCASEMRRHGLPLEGVLGIIFDSNLSKLDENGNAIIRDGKVQKGPNYWKPEPLIGEMLDGMGG